MGKTPAADLKHWICHGDKEMFFQLPFCLERMFGIERIKLAGR